MDTSLQEMAYEIPSDEEGYARCSDLDVPLFETKDFTAIAKTYLCDLTQFQWDILAKDCIDQDIVRILSSMLFDLVNAVTEVIYEHVAPQVQDRLYNPPVPDPSSMVTGFESLPQRNYTSVTEDDIHASIGDSLHFCFGETVEEKQCRSKCSEKLTELFVAEVTKGVNRKLSDITSCTWALPRKKAFTKSDTKNMVYYVSRIYTVLIRKATPSSEDSNAMPAFALAKRKAFKIPQDQEYLDNVLSEDVTSVLGQKESVLSDGGSIESPEDHLIYRLGTEELKEINSLLDELRSVPSGGDDAKVQGDQECLDKGSCPDKVTCVKVLGAEDDADTESVPEKDGSVLSGGCVKAQECLDGGCSEGSCPDKVTCVEVLGAEDDADTESVPEKDGSILSGGCVKAQECLDGGCSEGSCPDKVTCVEVLGAEDDADTESVPEKDGSVLSGGCVKAQECLDGGCSEGSCPDEVMNIEVFNAEDAEEINSIPEEQGSVLLDDQCPSANSTNGSMQEVKSVLTTFLGNLLTQITKTAKTPKFDVDFDGMVEGLNKKIAEQITSPQSVENAHIPVCKALCRMFGSAKMLQAAVVTREAIFIDAVARTLEVQLHKSTRKNSSFATRLKSFFRGKKAKISPPCETNTTEHRSDLINSETPPPQKKQKRPAIVRMFRILCRPFSFCISDRSQD